MSTYHFAMHQGEAKRLRLSLHADDAAAPAIPLDGVSAECRIQFGRHGDAPVETVTATIEQDVVIVDFGAVETGGWPEGRWSYQVWMRWTPEGGWEPRLGGDFRVMRGIAA